jgi:hypothetical protein
MPNDINEQFTELARVISKAALGWAQADKAVREHLEELRRPFRDAAEVIASAGLAARRSLEPVLSSASEWILAFQEQLASIAEEFARSLERFPEPTRDALRTLAQNGWYLDPYFPIEALFECERLFASGEAERAHSALSEWFDSRSAEIETTLCDQSPARARLLHKAFEAHQRGDFAVAIPVFLAQADGLCKEIMGVQLYKRSKKGVPVLASKLLPANMSPLLSSIVAPLVEPMPISAGPKERVSLPDALNRHAVLHGECLDYDTHLNSCRAVSLLVYVSWILRETSKPANP